MSINHEAWTGQDRGMHAPVPSPPAGGTRHHRVPPAVADALLAVAVTAITVIALILALPVLREEGSVPDPSLVTPMLVLAGLQGLTIAWWRSRPVAALVLALVLQVGLIVVSPEAPIRGLQLLLIAYSLGVRLPIRRVLAVIVPAILIEVLTAMLATTVGGGDVLVATLNQVLSAAAGYLLPTVLGITVASRLDNARLLRERAIRDHQLHVDTAIGEERRRIAGELHDVAAHHLSGMVVQAAAIERLVERDTQAAKDGAVHLRRQGKEALDGLRSVVGLLRDEGGMAPVPSLRDLPELIASTQALGVDAQLHSHGEAPDLAPVVGAAVYRVVQQALSNAMQHAPGAPVSVDLTTDNGELAVQITNAAADRRADHSSGRGGTGLVVMRERAALIGGDLVAGPAPGGGWRVRLSLPRTDGRSTA